MVWFDESAIPVGGSIPLEVEEGIEQSRAMILCLSPAFLESEWTKAERAAMQFADPANRDRTLIPVRFKRCVVPRTLGHLKHIDYLRHSDKVVDELVAALPVTPTAGPSLPSPVVALLDEAKETRKAGAYAAATEITARALDMAVANGSGTPEEARDLARARTAHSNALLLCERDFETAWQLAEAGADPVVLDGYPELLFRALTCKAEAAAATGRMQAARGAAKAAAEFAEDAHDERALLQLRGEIALRSRSPTEAVALYEEAEQSFLALLNSDPEDAVRVRAKVGVGACLTNKALALRGAGDITGAKAALRRAAEWYVEGGSPIDESVARRDLARCHFDERDWKPGFAALDEAETLAERESFTSGLVECLELRARALATTDQFGPATEALRRALELLGASEPKTRRRYHQMLATLASDMGDPGTARRHLDTARVMADQDGDTLTIADVRLQADELTKRLTRHNTRAPDDVIDALRTQLEKTEIPGKAAHTMQQLAGAYRSNGDLRHAGEWFRRAHDAALAVADEALAAAALIGLAELAITEDRDGDAVERLTQARALVERLPAWEVKASALYYTGKVEARNGDLRSARRTLDAAHEIAAEHHIEHLTGEIEDLREDLDDWLSIRALPSMELPELADEIAGLEDWYPEARQRLRRMWWYWRGDEVMRNLIAHSGAKSVIVSDNAQEISDLADDLGVLFEVTTFVTEASFALSEPVQTFVPFPKDVALPPYVNLIAIAKDDGT